MKYFDLIYDYKEGQLSADDRTQFEHELATNPELQEALKDHETAERIAEGLLEVDMLETINKLQKVDSEPEETSQQSGTKGISSKWLYLLAVLGVALIITFFYYSNRAKKINPEQFFAEYYQEPIMDDLTRGEALKDTDLFRAQNLFHQKKYQESEQLLINLVQKEESKSMAHYYLGHIYLNLQEYKKAALAFSQSQEPGALYNLVLSYLLMGDKGSAEKLFSGMNDMDRERLRDLL